MNSLGVYGRNSTRQGISQLDRDHKQDILHQIAAVFKLIHNYPVSESAKGYEVLVFNESGEIVIEPTTIPCGEPFSNFTRCTRRCDAGS